MVKHKKNYTLLKCLQLHFKSSVKFEVNANIYMLGILILNVYISLLLQNINTYISTDTIYHTYRHVFQWRVYHQGRKLSLMACLSPGEETVFNGVFITREGNCRRV